MKSLYFLILFFTVIVPFLFSFHRKLRFDRHFKAFFAASIPVAFVFIVWDIFFTRLGVWGFNPDYLSGLYISNLPLEEVLFFICIPFSCVFTYHCLCLFYKFEWSRRTETAVVLLFAGILLGVGLYNYERLYPAYTFISLALVLLILKFALHVSWIPRLMSIYVVLLLPFAMVNGVLTGSGLPEPVVWYNNAENLGIRLGTIPVEDVFYGFELILLNVWLFERFKSMPIFQTKP